MPKKKKYIRKLEKASMLIRYVCPVTKVRTMVTLGSYDFDFWRDEDLYMRSSELSVDFKCKSCGGYHEYIIQSN